MPPVYEALLLNTVVPQIQAAQAGDSYVMVVNATTPALRITQTGTGDAILVEDAANPDATPFVVTAGGDVGIGTSSPGVKLDVVGQGRVLYNTGATNTGDQSVVTVGATTSGAYASSYGAGLQFQITNSGGGFAGSRIVSRLGADNNTANLVFQARNYGFSDSMTLDASGNLGVGETSPTSRLHVAFTSNSADAIIRVQQKGSNTAAGLTLSANDNNGAGYNFIRSETTGGTAHWAITGGVATSTMAFSTGGTERARITSGGDLQIANGNLVMSTSGKGIDFAATAGPTNGTMTSELLADYEEGTWTPTADSGVTYSAGAVGKYTKTGRAVYCYGAMDVTAISGNIVIGGLPFTNSNTTIGRAATVTASLQNGTSNAVENSFVDGNATTFNIKVSGTYSGSAITIYFACWYFV